MGVGVAGSMLRRRLRDRCGLSGQVMMASEMQTRTAWGTADVCCADV